MLLKIIVLLVIAACVAPFFIQGPNGKPLMTVDDWFDADEPAETTTVVYKWQDAAGTWHYTDELPEDIEGQVVSLSEPINTLPPPKAATAPKDVRMETERLAAGAAAVPGGLTISSDQMGEMMDTVGNLQQDLDDRAREIRERSQAR